MSFGATAVALTMAGRNIFGCGAHGAKPHRVHLNTDRRHTVAPDLSWSDAPAFPPRSAVQRKLSRSSLILINGKVRRTCPEDHNRRIGRIYLPVGRRDRHRLRQRLSRDGDCGLHILSRRLAGRRALIPTIIESVSITPT
jgi:hypothetical protein